MMIACEGLLRENGKQELGSRCGLGGRWLAGLPARPPVDSNPAEADVALESVQMRADRPKVVRNSENDRQLSRCGQPCYTPNP